MINIEEKVYICNNGDYYIGDFKDGFKHGEGILYSKNGDIIIKGKFINNNIKK